MLHIVIADDEATIREGMAKMIRKESERFIVTGSFANGQEVLDFAAASEIDVVITDIRMPLVDGLDLIKKLQSISPNTRCIMMSGFTDFEYARQALRCSAVDYLLKPINKSQLFSLLYDLDKKQEAARGEEQRLRSGLLVSYLQSSPAFCSKLPALCLPLPYYAVTVLRGHDIEALRSNVSLLQRQPNNRPLDILDSGDGTMILMSYYEKPPSSEDIAELADRLRLYPQPGIVLAGASRGYSNPVLLSQAYSEATAACDRGMYESKSWSYSAFDLSFMEKVDWQERFDLIRESWVQSLQVLNISRTSGILNELFMELQQARASRNSVLQLCQLISEAAAAELKEWKEAPSADFFADLEQFLADHLTFSEIKMRFTAELSQLLNHIREGRLDQGGQSIEIVKRWINQHYYKTAELSLLANLVYLTPNYLSKLFKQETGITITDYIIEVRIRKAKEMLIDSPEMKVHEVGCEIGYPDPAYFNKLFKRVVGVTPNEYRRVRHTCPRPAQE